MSRYAEFDEALEGLIASGAMTWPEGWTRNGKALLRKYGEHTCSIELGVWMTHNGIVSDVFGLQADPRVPSFYWPAKGPRKPSLEGVSSPGHGEQWSAKKLSRAVALAAKAVDKYMAEFIPLFESAREKANDKDRRRAKMPEVPDQVKQYTFEDNGMCRLTIHVKDKDLDGLFRFLRRKTVLL